MGGHHMSEYDASLPACCYLGLRHVRYHGEFQPCTVISRDDSTEPHKLVVTCNQRQYTIPEPHVYIGSSTGPAWMTDYGGAQMGRELPQMIAHFELRLKEAKALRLGPGNHEFTSCHCMLGNAHNR